MAKTATTITASMSKDGRTMLVANATGFAVGQVVKLEDEYLVVTGVSGLAIDVFRGRYGSAAKAHVSGVAAVVGDPGDFPWDGVGTVQNVAGVSVTEIVNGRHHITKFDLNGFTIGASVGAANLAFGSQIYTFPAGTVQVKSSTIALGVFGSGAACDADTPDLGLGTVVAAGANATLNLTAGAENVMTGQTMNDCAGTVENAGVATTLAILPADSHNLFLNMADGWAGAATFTAVGSITVEWVQI